MTHCRANPSAGQASTPAAPHDHTSTHGAPDHHTSTTAASDGHTSTTAAPDGHTSTTGAPAGHTSTPGAPERHTSIPGAVVRLLPPRRRRGAVHGADPRAPHLRMVAPNEAAARPSPIRLYRPPLLVELDNAADLLEVLGPAQASYGGTGFA